MVFINNHLHQIFVIQFDDENTLPLPVVSGYTIDWQHDNSNEYVDISVQDVTTPQVFVAPAGRGFVIGEEYITPGHTYEVKVIGMTSMLEGKAEFRAGEMSCLPRQDNAITCMVAKLQVALKYSK